MRAHDIEMACGFVSSLDEDSGKKKELKSAVATFARYIARMPKGIEQNAAIFSLKKLTNQARQNGAE